MYSHVKHFLYDALIDASFYFFVRSLYFALKLLKFTPNNKTFKNYKAHRYIVIILLILYNIIKF